MKNLNTLLKTEFPVENNLTYLNHAAVAPWPLRTAKAVADFSNQCVSNGSQHFNSWIETENNLRSTCADFIGADHAQDIAFLKNTSEGLSVVAHGFPWSSGDNVVFCDEEFPSNRIVWQSLDRYGVEARQVSLSSAESPEDALLNAVDKNTRMIAVSSVQYASGLRIDLERLGSECKKRNIAFCVDAIQALGAIKQDVQAMNIDFLISDAHKWLLGPEGIAVFYCSPEWRDRLSLVQYGWHMVENHFDFSNLDWKPANSGRRFECGSNNMLGIQALTASLSLLLEIGITEVEKRILANSRLIIDAVNDHPNLDLLSNAAAGRVAGIVTFKHSNEPVEEVFERLVKNNIQCAIRGGGIRFSPHCYADENKMLAAVKIAAN